MFCQAVYNKYISTQSILCVHVMGWEHIQLMSS